jgi:hypothetical protein
MTLELGELLILIPLLEQWRSRSFGWYCSVLINFRVIS